MARCIRCRAAWRSCGRWSERSKERVLDLVDEQTEYLAKLERKAMERRYDPSQPFIAALFGVPAGYAAYRLWQFGDWYWKVSSVVLWLFVGLLLYAGVTGLFTAPRTRKRPDEEPAS